MQVIANARFLGTWYPAGTEPKVQNEPSKDPYVRTALGTVDYSKDFRPAPKPGTKK